MSAAVFAALGLAVAACGGESQDAHEPSGNFKVQVVRASFPKQQKLAKRSHMVIVVKNVDSRTLPNVAVTVNSFNRVSTAKNLADPQRPVFVVNAGPTGGETANQATSAHGPLGPGDTARFDWDVTAVHTGRYNIRWEISAGLFGKARAVGADGKTTPTGHFAGEISGAAPRSRVDFKNGRTVEGG